MYNFMRMSPACRAMTVVRIRVWLRCGKPYDARTTMPALRMNPIAVIDFETTGLSPAMGDRSTEIAIVLLEGSLVVARFQSLMKAGSRISRFMAAFHALGGQCAARAAGEVAALPAQGASEGSRRVLAGAAGIAGSASSGSSSLTAGSPGFPPPRE
jgi:hypothetical protein